MKKWIALLLAFTLGVVAVAEEGAGLINVPTTAVLPFEARGRQSENDNEGKSVAELVTVELMEQGIGELVERAELDKALSELQLSAIGLVDKQTQLKLGKLVGAKILITGAMFKSGEKNFIVAKIIGTETSRVVGCSVSGRDDFSSMVPGLAKKIALQLEKNHEKLMPKPTTAASVLAELEPVVKGNKRKVFVKVSEDINVSVPDPAAETELKKLLLALGFEVVELRDGADFAVIGEAVAATAGSYHKFTSAAARVELSIYAGQKLLATSAGKETLAGATYVLAAKDAVAQVTLRLAGDLFGVMK